MAYRKVEGRGTRYDQSRRAHNMPYCMTCGVEIPRYQIGGNFAELREHPASKCRVTYLPVERGIEGIILPKEPNKLNADIDRVRTMPEFVKLAFLRSGLTVDEFERRVANILNKAFEDGNGLS